jgi:hypothetical protein
MNPDCPACFEKRIHSTAETLQFHPLAGHGFDWRGWSSPEAQKASKTPKAVHQSPEAHRKPPAGPQDG